MHERAEFVEKVTGAGFKVEYGPVRATDLPAYLLSHTASPEMRRVRFDLRDRVVLIPVLAGIALEYVRWTANHLDRPLVRLLIRPNLALQALTTREPDRSMLEVAIASFI